MRHSILTEYDPAHGVSISTLAYEYARRHHVEEHAHGSDQLVYAIRGVMRVSAGRSVWLTPPHFAVWIPAGTQHSIDMLGQVSMRTLYLRRGLAQGLPSACTVFNITPLLRELIVEAVRIKELRRRQPLHCALKDLLISQLQSASPLPTTVMLPTDPRARAIADTIMADPAKRQSLASMSGSVGASVRTIQRLFLREVGSDFDFWRRKVRLVKAVELLISGQSVKETSFALGYRQPTAFVEMFRRILGTTPGAWVQALRSKSLND